MSQEVSIKVMIADREYPLKLSEDERDMVQGAEQEIDRKIKALKANYQVKEKQDLLAMSLLQLLVEKNKQLKLGVEEALDMELYGKIADLESFVSDYLKQQ